MARSMERSTQQATGGAEVPVRQRSSLPHRVEFTSSGLCSSHYYYSRGAGEGVGATVVTTIKCGDRVADRTP